MADAFLPDVFLPDVFLADADFAGDFFAAARFGGEFFVDGLVADERLAAVFWAVPARVARALPRVCAGLLLGHGAAPRQTLIGSSDDRRAHTPEPVEVP